VSRSTFALAVAVWALSLTAFAAGESKPTELRERVLFAMSRLWFHGIDDEIANREVGPEGVPVLLELLADPRFPRRDNVVAFLTHLDGPGITDGLMEFLSSPPADPSIPEEDRALLLAPGALGAAAARGDEPARRALRAMSEGNEEHNPLVRAFRAGAYGRAMHDDLVEEAIRARSKIDGDPSEPSTFDPEGPARFDAGSSTSANAPSPLSVDPSAVIHDAAITYANHVDHVSPMTDDRLDRILGHAAGVAGHVDFPEDHGCCITMTRSGSARSFGTPGDGLDRVDDEAEANRVLGSGVSRVKVVRSISWCGGPGTNIAGCAYRGGGSMMVVRLSNYEVAEGVLWLHEYGHNT
jgi:hypothetical protein